MNCSTWDYIKAKCDFKINDLFVLIWHCRIWQSSNLAGNLKKSPCNHTQNCSLVFFWENLTMTKNMKMPHHVPLQPRKPQFPHLAVPFSMHASVCTQRLDMHLHLCASEESVCKGWICWLFPYQLLTLSWKDTIQSRTPAQELMSHAGTRPRFSAFTTVTHFCQDYPTESCISKHGVGVKTQILDWFPSSPHHCFLSRTLQRQLEHGILVDPHAVDCFNIQAEIRFVTISMQKVNLLVRNSLGKLFPG